MKRFEYTLTAEQGIHARPAGLLAKEAGRFPDTGITISLRGNEAGAGQLLRLMSLGAKHGDTVTVTVQGGDEQAAFAAMQEFFKKHL